MRIILTAAVACLAAVPLWAQGLGDAEAGKRAFNQCVPCHMVINDAGEKLAGRNGRNGPNLYGLPDRPAATVAGFRYSSGMRKAGEAGLIWTEENFAAFVQNTNGFLGDYLGDKKIRSTMILRLRNPDDAADLYAYLQSLSPAPQD
ncbi:MAG: c-type cytochrome [Qingshengfaniella sp.]